MKILLAVDESPYADKIVQFVLKQHWFDDAQITVLHVIEPLKIGSYLSVLPSPLLDEIKNKAKLSGEHLLSTIAGKLSQAHPAAEIKEHLVEGFVREEIINYAKTWPADLIVVGSHGHSRVMSMLLGSVSQAVVTTAPCAVLLVRSEPEEMPQWPRSH